MFEYYNHLGARAYYWDGIDSRKCRRSIADIERGGGDEWRIDPVGVLGVSMKNYCIGTRTLVSGVERTPWMARPDSRGAWEFAELPMHSCERRPTMAIASELCNRLYEEALHFVASRKNIGILLSGGMDSRVVAGVVRHLQLNKDFTGSVTALTWGIADSRDVVLAREIATRFGWEFIHFPLTSETLHENILLAADMGAEFSPVHLHAMKAVSETTGLDGILAGSYGDSIGRGEYSGMKVKHLPMISASRLNYFAFLLRETERHAYRELMRDIESARTRFQRRSEQARREIEMQMHYMRRQLNACMAVIDDRIPTYQMFSHPAVFKVMWRLDPRCRTDEVYAHLLAELPGELLEIPWARTGVRYGSNVARPRDKCSGSNNHYGAWLRGDCRSLVLHLISDGSLQRLGIFNQKSLDMWAKHWGTSKELRADRLDEKMAWLASLAAFVAKYRIGRAEAEAEYKYDDWVAERKALLYTWLYQRARVVVAKRVSA